MFTIAELESIDKAEESLKKLCPNSIVIAKRTSGPILLLNVIPIITQRLPETVIIISNKPFSSRIKEGVNVTTTSQSDLVRNTLKNILGHDIHLKYVDT